ncbi:pentapeptide repeat-containing protein [Streptomyces sp. NBC_00582]|uniref:pentapeptide repeat-containing protein n=1 Tax=Streptomyces sp. NBC_00582 TaxID=2975783 RepID=UPI002E804195|nr:pentapeptide repeat-containing protein [Streptomyces sp. NBC_00582]WUB63204.1 pentapeptide repeat-containing protein [Streptomyces sp. NBC_00582]
MDFTSWGDWLRACLGAAVTFLLIIPGWRLVARAAAFGDPHRHTGRRIGLVPRRAIRPRADALRPRLRGARALRRYYGTAATTPFDEQLDRLAEADRSARVLVVGRRVWCGAVPLALLLSGALLGAWIVVGEYVAGPFVDVYGPSTYLPQIFGTDGWYVQGDDACASWSLLTGCEADAWPWWHGAERGLLFGMALACVGSAWLLRRAALRSFAVWARQEPPLLACLDALTAARDALRLPSPEATVLDEKVAELRVRLLDFARESLPLDTDRRADLEEHSRRVTDALKEATGRFLSDGTTALPDLVELLATLQDRLHASRWFALLDPAQMAPVPSPGPPPAPAPAAAAGPAADTGRWQRYMWVATAMPTVPALLALAFTAVTISQADENLGLTRRDQVATTYSEAVDGLGDDSIDVRTSNILLLQGIMRESPGEQPAIVKILSGYIRNRAKMPAKATADRLRKNTKTRPAADVQAALDALGSRLQNVEADPYIDLRDTFLVGADLTGAQFAGADLRGADLSRAFLTQGEFSYALFNNARMEGAELSDGNFYDADLTSTDLTGAWLDGTNLVDADLTSARLTKAIGVYEGDSVYLVDADLTAADLSEADLRGADLSNADLGRDDRQGLPAADVTGTNFIGADLDGTRLVGVDRAKALWGKPAPQDTA